jgi:hypothetical protein
LDPVAFGILDSPLRLGKVVAAVRQLCDLLVVGLRLIAMNYRDARYCYELGLERLLSTSGLLVRYDVYCVWSRSARLPSVNGSSCSLWKND